MLSAGDFEENFDAIQNARKNFVQVENIEKSYEKPVAAMSASFVESEYLIDLKKAGAVDANGNIVNPTLWQTTINKTAERVKKLGANAFSEEEINAAADNAYYREYSKYMKDKGFALMPIEEYRRNFKDAITRGIDYETEKLTETDAWNQAVANRTVNKTVLTPVERTMNIGGKTRNVVVHGLGYGSGVKGGLVGGFRGTYINPVTGKTESGSDAKGYITGRIEGQDDNGNTITYYELTDYTPGSPTQGQIRIVPSNSETDAVYQQYLDQNNVEVSSDKKESGSATGTSVLPMKSGGIIYQPGTGITAPSTTNKPSAY
jgi:uncharacterized protein YcfJ